MNSLLILFYILAKTLAIDLVLNQNEKLAINKFEFIDYNPDMFVIKTLMTDAWITIDYDGDYDGVYLDKTGSPFLTLSRPTAQYFNRLNDSRLIDFLSELHFSLNNGTSIKTDVKFSSVSNGGNDLVLVNQYEDQIFAITTADGQNVICYEVDLNTTSLNIYFDNITSSCNKLFTLDLTDCVPVTNQNQTNSFKLKMPCGSYQYMSGLNEDQFMNLRSDENWAWFSFGSNGSVLNNITYLSYNGRPLKSFQWYVLRAYGYYTEFWYSNSGSAPLSDSRECVIEERPLNGSTYPIIFINFWGSVGVDPVTEKLINKINCGFLEIQYQ